MKRTALYAFLVALVVAIAYAPVRSGVFIWDDHVLIERDKELDTASLGRLMTKPLFVPDPEGLTAGSEVESRPAYYRPVVTLSYALDRALFERSPIGPHIVNVLLHMLATVLLVFAARKFGASLLGACASAAAWALFPRNTESVAWISGRTDVLAAVFILGAILVWKDVAWRIALGCLLLLLGLLSKEVALAGFVAVVFMGGRARARKNLAVLAVPFGLWLVLRQSVLARTSLPSRPHAPFIQTVLESIGRYAQMTVVGWTPRSAIGLVGEIDRPRAILGAVVLFLGVVAVVRFRKRISVGVVLGMSAILPVLHILPIGLNAALVSDRLLYIPLLGAFLALSTKRIAPALGVLALSYLPVTYARSKDYTDELAFWLTAAETAHPHNTAPRSALANHVRELGAPELACGLHQSSRQILDETGRHGTPRYRRSLGNVASCFALVGRYEEAEHAYRELLQEKEAAWVWIGLGYVKLHEIKLDEARHAFERARELDPNSKLARQNLADLPALTAQAKRFESDEAKAQDPQGWARLRQELGQQPIPPIPDRVRAQEARIRALAADRQ